MRIKKFFRQIVQINRDIKEEKFQRDQKKAHQFIRNLTHAEKEALLAALIIAGVEHDEVTIDEYIEELEINISLKRKQFGSKQAIENDSNDYVH